MGYPPRLASKERTDANLGHRATRRLGVLYSIPLGRSFRKKPSDDMVFPHPQSRKDHYRKKDIPSWGGVVWKFFKRAINVTEYRNGKDDVNPAKNRTLGGIADHGRLRRGVARLFCDAFFCDPVDSRVLRDRKSIRLNSSHVEISYAVF